MGLLGSDFLGTGLSVEDVQILTALAHHGHAVGLAQITAHLPYSQSAVSRLADSLIKQGLMAKTVDPADRRRFFVHLTLEGKRCINTALDTASRALEPACVALGKRYARLEEALMRFLPEATVAAKESSVTVHHVESDAERRLARAFLMEELVRTQRHLDASETLISRENTVLTLNSDENIVGVLEVSKRGHRYYVENFALAAQHPTSGTLMLLLDGLRTLDRPAHGARSIVVKKTIADEFPDLLSLGASSPDEPHTWEIPFPARTH
jgi:DNA-binding MarR family transcriptional regulator